MYIYTYKHVCIYIYTLCGTGGTSAEKHRSRGMPILLARSLPFGAAAVPDNALLMIVAQWIHET